MLGRLFDSPAQLLIIVLIVVLLFGATRLPNAARQLGRSMRIFKSEIKEMQADGKDDTAPERRDTGSTTPEPLSGRVVDEEHPPRATTAEQQRASERRDG